MLSTRHTIVAITGLLAIGLCQHARAQLVRSECFGEIDYAHELALQNVALVSSVAVGGGLVRVALSGQLSNTGGGDFTLASVRPDPTQTALGIVADDPAADPMTFGAIGPAGAAPSTADMTVVLPADQVGQLIGDLNSGALPVVVHAVEAIEAAAGNKIGYLSGVGPLGDVMEDGAGNVISYVWPSQSQAPLTQSGVVRFHSLTPDPVDDFPAELESATGDSWYVMGTLFDEFAPDSWLPEDLRHGRIRVDTLPDDDVPFYFRYLFRLWDVGADTDVADVFHRGSFCTTPAHHIDPIDGGTRVQTIDGGFVPLAERNANPQGIRFNKVVMDGVTLSGQVQGHAIRPSIQVSVRPGDEKRFVATLETDLSFSAEVTAEANAPVIQNEVDLKDLCFPLPPLPLGPIEIPLSLHLGHTIGLNGNLRAASTIGLQKRVASGYRMGWDQRRPPGTRWFADAFSRSTPMAFTPPRLLEDAQATLGISSNLQLTLNVGTTPDVFGNCIAQAGPYIVASAGGAINVSPSDDPWWSLSHSAAISGGLDMELLGFSLVNQEAALVEFPGSETLSGPRTRGAAAVSGQDQRWAINAEDVVNNAPGEMTGSQIAATPDGGAVVISNTLARLSAYDADGRYRWDRRFALGYTPGAVFAAYDGTIYTTGDKIRQAWIAAHDPDGNLLWSREFALADPATGSDCQLTRAAMHYDTAPTFLLTGRLVFQALPKACALKVDGDGQIVWAKIFEFGLPVQAGGVDTDGDGVDDDVDNCPWIANPGQGDQNADGVGDACASANHSALGTASLSDGGFAIVGKMSTVSSSSDPFLMRIDAQGEVLWARGYYGRARQFNAVTEGRDGRLYMTGEAHSTLNLTEASFLVAAVDADGSGGAGSLLFGDELWESELGQWDNAQPPSILNSYNDGGLGIAPAPDGAIVVGHIGAPAATTVAGIAVKLNSSLGTEWHMTWDHPDHVEVMHSIAPVDGGYLMSGRTNSFNPDNLGSLLVMKLPFEGSVAPGAGYVSRYVATGSTGETGANQPGFAPILLHSVDGVSTDLGPVGALHVASDGLCITRLTQTGADSPLSNCGDDDGDGIDNALDNCTQIANPPQRDTDGDGYGNYCDADFNNDGIVNAIDLGQLRLNFFSTDPHADLNGDGAVNAVDLGLLKSGFFLPPGPSGLAP